MLLSAFPLFGVVASLTAWIGATLGPPVESAGTVRRTIIRDDIVIHVPIGHRPPALIEWIERKGPKCLPAQAIAGAAMAGPLAIDFVLRDRRRIRAKLDSDCAGLDFYGGFYVEPEDDAICVRREEIRSRVGASCRIDRFRRLIPKLKR